MVRGDSGFCRWRMLRWFDRNGVGYVIGVAKNPRLLARSSALRALAEDRYRATGEKQSSVRRGALRRARLGRLPDLRDRKGRARRPGRQSALRGHQPRARPATQVYDRIYCARGDMENRIKEQQLDLFADRTSCHKWWANQFRLLHVEPGLRAAGDDPP